MRVDHITTVSMDNGTKENKNKTYESSCMVARVKKVFSMGETKLNAKFSYGSIKLVETLENLALKPDTSVALNIVDKARGIPPNFQIENLSLPFITVLKEMKTRSSVAPR